MASRKMKKVATRKPKVSEKTLGESIIEQMVRFNTTLLSIHAAMTERNGMLAAVTKDEPTPLKMARAAPVVIGLVTTEPQKAVEHLQMVEDTVEHSTLPVAATPRKRGRPSRADLAARVAAAGPVMDGTPLENNPLNKPPVEKFPQMCPCGVREDVPKHLHAKGCPVHFPAEPVPEHRAAPQETTVAPTLDDVRATAIAYVGTHGKEKLAEILKGFGADKLSSVPAEKLPALLAALQNGG